MKSERLNISPNQRQQITNMLQSQGLSQAEIDVILNGEYESYDSEYDVESAFGELRKYDDILEGLAAGYKLDELQTRPTRRISPEEIDNFNQMLLEKNMNVEGAKALYQYCDGSHMISGRIGGKSKEEIKNNIIQVLENDLRMKEVQQDDIELMKEFVMDAEYGEKKLYENWDIARNYMEQLGLKKSGRLGVLGAMKFMDRCEHIDETIVALKENLGKMNMPKSMKLYRALDSPSLEKYLREGEDLSSLVGKNIGNNQMTTSTSLLYDTSFARQDGKDAVIEIYAPKGSIGAYIAGLSGYDKAEQEVLLNPNDLYITGVQTGVVDKNGKTKNVLQALCLSKDRECYKGIDKEQDTSRASNGQQQYEKNVDSQNNGANLPARQNRFSKFFSQMRSRFVRQNRDTNSNRRNPFSRKKQETPQYSKDIESAEQQISKTEEKVHERKSWELAPEEKARVQRETDEILRKHSEQVEQQRQAPDQDLQQEDFQQMQQGQATPQIQQPSTQDFGGMEL